MIDYILNGIAFTLGCAIGVLIVCGIVNVQERIEKNKRYGRKWWKI